MRRGRWDRLYTTEALNQKHPVPETPEPTVLPTLFKVLMVGPRVVSDWASEEEKAKAAASRVGHSIHGGKATWDLPTQLEDGTWKPGRWKSLGKVETHSRDGRPPQKTQVRVYPCYDGLHVTAVEDLTRWLSSRLYASPAPSAVKVFEVEVGSGEVVRSVRNGIPKYACTKVRLVREIDVDQVPRPPVSRELDERERNLPTVARSTAEARLLDEHREAVVEATMKYLAVAEADREAVRALYPEASTLDELNGVIRNLVDLADCDYQLAFWTRKREFVTDVRRWREMFRPPEEVQVLGDRHVNLRKIADRTYRVVPAEVQDLIAKLAQELYSAGIEEIKRERAELESGEARQAWERSVISQVPGFVSQAESSFDLDSLDDERRYIA